MTPKPFIKTKDIILEYFDMLPSNINLDGHLYHFRLTKGNHGIYIQYIDSDGEYLKNTWRSGDTLNLASKSMVEWLYKFEFVQYMPYGYKKKYEVLFNTKINHSRGFDE